DASGTLTTLHAYTPSEGAKPYGQLIEGSDGNFYGTTTEGGAYNLGAIFKIDPSGFVVTLHSFAGFTEDGAVPEAGLIRGNDGNFYGTTFGGGESNQGTVFKMDSSGTVSTVVTTLHSFVGSGGATLIGGVIQATDGDFYGTTWLGGTSLKGTLFKMNASGDV